MMPSWLRVLVAAMSVAPTVMAQQSRTASGTISGSVVDAVTDAPIPGASVTLTGADDFVLLPGASTTSRSMSLARMVTTSASGTYRFGDLAIGAYRLLVQRVGYAPATVDVRLGETGVSPVSVGLVVVPVRLRAVEIRAPLAVAAGEHGLAHATEDPRVSAVRERQREFLSTDARELTTADFNESATLGGGDVLRAMQRLPGVSPFDAWSAKLWVRGNRWDHNRIYFDDLPIFDPLQALGQTTGVTSDAIGAAFVHPGVRPVSLGGEGATRIDLRTRPASTNGDWHGSAQMSRFGVSAAAEHSRVDSPTGFAVTGQHTLGLLSGKTSDRFNDAQASARADLDLGNGRSIQASSLLSRDEREYRGTELPSFQNWGNVVGRVTVRVPLAAVVASQSFGISHFASSSSHFSVDVGNEPGTASGTHFTNNPLTSSVDYLTIDGRVSAGTATSHELSTGYGVTLQRSALVGPRASVFRNELSLDRLVRRDAIRYGTVWIEDRTQMWNRLSLSNGIRLDVGGPADAEALRPAGSAQARLAVGARTWLSAGVSRTQQYTQSLQQTMTAQGEMPPSLWLTAGNGVPSMSVDNAMMGVERWVASGVLVTANAYVRATRGAIADDPTPGPLIDRTLFAVATESSHGVEVSARKLTGRTTGLIAYSYGDATMRFAGLSFPAPASRTHALDAVMSMHFGALSLGSAYALASGAPYTRVILPSVENGATSPEFRDAPNAHRLPVYSSLDLSLDYAHAVSQASIIAFAGLQNALGHANATWYQGSICEDGDIMRGSREPCRGHDVFEAPVRFAPTLGLRVVF